MKGLYILAFVLGLISVLSYMVFKQSDSDLRRTYDHIVRNMSALDERLAQLETPLAELRRKKRRTHLLDKEFEQLQKKVSALRSTSNAATHNIENLTDQIRGTASKALDDLRQDSEKTLYAAARFGNKVSIIHAFVTEGYPLLDTLENLQKKLNTVVQDREEAGDPLPMDKTSDLESYYMESKNIRSLAMEAMKTFHTNIEDGKVMANTAINDLKTLIPALEAFLQDISEKK